MRSVNHAASKKRKKKILKLAKGYFGRKKNVWTVAKNQVEKSLEYAYIGRKVKKRDFRSLWIQRINAAARMHGMTYSVFLFGLKEAGIELDRKTLSDIAIHDPEGFAAIAKQAQSKIKQPVKKAA